MVLKLKLGITVHSHRSLPALFFFYVPFVWNTFEIQNILLSIKFLFIYYLLKCSLRTPPGREVVRTEKFSIFEVDGFLQKAYCQNLCLISKLFLDHKTLFVFTVVTWYFDVEPFLFYVMVKSLSQGASFLGYFSKVLCYVSTMEKFSPDQYNLACIVTLPPYQRQGLGQEMIALCFFSLFILLTV